MDDFVPYKGNAADNKMEDHVTETLLYKLLPCVEPSKQYDTYL